MNERQFAAAHDRYLNPPDYDEEDEIYECTLAELAKQRRIDAEDFAARNAENDEYWKNQE